MRLVSLWWELPPRLDSNISIPARKMQQFFVGLVKFFKPPLPGGPLSIVTERTYATYVLSQVFPTRFLRTGEPGPSPASSTKYHRRSWSPYVAGPPKDHRQNPTF